MKRKLLVASILFLSACGAAKIGTDPSALQESEHVLLMNRGHKLSLKVVKSKIEKLPSGQMEVAVEIENRNNDDIFTDIQVVFRGADGFEIEKTSWTPFQFPHHAVTTYKASSMSPNVVDYRILIRKPQ